MEQSTRPARTHSEAHELVAVILLSLVAVLTAWCGFQSTKWGGDRTEEREEATKHADELPALALDFGDRGAPTPC